MIFFLKADRSLRDDLASNFKAELIWKSGEIIKKQLNEKTDKDHNNKFTFEIGSIENSAINKHASDTLEGTLNAFNDRRLKYI